MKQRPSFLQWLDSASLVLLLVTMCSQLDVRNVGTNTWAQGLGYVTKTLAVALSDVIFAAVVLCFVARTIQMNGWKRLWWPPLACWAVIFALVISMFHSTSIHDAVVASIAKNGIGPKAFITKESKEAIAEIVQWTGYFLVAPWIFVNLIWDRRSGETVIRRRMAIVSFLVAGSIVGLVALIQRFTFADYPPRSLFVSPNIFSAFAAMFLAFAVTVLAKTATNPNRPAAQKALVIGAGLVIALFALAASISSIWALVALLIGLFVASMRSRWWPLAAAAAVLIAWTALFPNTKPVQETRNASVSLSSKDQKDPSKIQKVKKQLVEWQAAIGWNAPRERAFANGVGPGNYQLNIGPLYSSLPNEEKLPPDSNNLYLVQAVSIGTLGLGALLWVVGHFYGLAWRAIRTNPTDWLPVGVIAALSTWFFVNLFHAMIVRGAGLVLAFMFALAVIAAQGRNQDQNAVSEN